ncbi:polyphosphate polymerase domain-containing protein [Spirillospora sp. NPDC047418]
MTTPLAALPAVDLTEVLARSTLQLRLDRKYLVPSLLLPRLLEAMAGTYAALEIDGLRTFRYTSTYFDTPDLLTYRQHLQDRRRRFKIRTRTYLDSGECTFEVKLSGTRDSTDKRRMPYDPANRTELTPSAHDFLWQTLLSAYRMNPPSPLTPTATTSYNRTTLVQRQGTGRVTLDTALVCTAQATSIEADQAWVLLESKSETPDAPADRLLRHLGQRPTKLSKYCLAIAALYPGTTSNPWHRPLRRYFTPTGP